MAWQSRMQWELKQLVNSPPPGVVVWPEGESLARLQAQVEGPPDTVYEGGVFRLDIQIPERWAHWMEVGPLDCAIFLGRS